jgi:hypothetical protein
MKEKLTPLERRLRLAGSLIIVGLLIELITLYWSHPTAFLFFLLPGGILIGTGILFYLYSLVAGGHAVKD